MEKNEIQTNIVPVTSSNEKAKEYFEKARFLVQTENENYTRT